MYSFTPEPHHVRIRQEILDLTADMPRIDKATEPYRPLWEHLGRNGLPGMAIPETYGGRGFDALTTVIALEALGYGHADNGFNFSVAAHLLACVVPLWLYGSEELKSAYLPGLSSGRLIAANGMSEPSSGSDAFSMKTTARSCPDGYCIQGSKTFVSNGPIADTVLLYAATDPDKGFLGGISALWIDKTIHPYSSGDELAKAGLHHSTLGTLFFEDLIVPTRYLVGHEGRGAHVFNRSMEWERTCLGALHLGNLHRLIDRCVKQLRSGFQTGIPRESRQVVMHDLAFIQTRLEAVRLQTYAAAWKMDQQKPVGREAAMAKLAVSELYKQASQRLAEIFAEIGAPDRDAEQSALDAVSSTLYSGTSEMQKMIIAQSMGL